MKTAYKLTLALLALSPIAAVAAPPTPVQTPAQAPDKAAQAPAQPAATTAQGNTGYRAYSYMPSSAPSNYGGYSARRTREPGFFSGHQSAGYKVRGEFWAR